MSCKYIYKGKKHNSVNDVKDTLNQETKRIVEPKATASINSITLSRDGNIQTINANDILNARRNQNKAIGNYIDSSVSENSRIVAREVVKKIAKVAPGVNIFVETKNTAFNKTGSRDVKGFISKNGYHIVAENLTKDTAVHELTELWLKVLQNTNEESYNSLMNTVIEHMNNNSDIVELITDTYREGLSLDSDTELINEYISTIAGFGSVDALRMHLLGKGKEDIALNKSNNIFTKISNVIKSIFRGIGTALGIYGKNNSSYVQGLDLSIATLEDIALAINMDYESGNSIFTNEEAVMINHVLNEDKLLQRKNVYSAPLLGTKEIYNINDFDEIFTRDEMSLNTEGVYASNKQRAEYLFHNVVRTNSRGDSFIYIKGKKYSLYGTDEQMKSQIELDVIPELDKFQKKRESDLYIFLSDNKNETELMDNLHSFINNSNSGFSYSAVQKLINLSGLANGYSKIIKFSELHELGDPRLSSLGITNAFEGYDPYIIIHNNIDSDVLNISILEITGDYLKSKNRYIRNNNIVGNIMSDSEALEKGITMSNTVGGIKQFKSGLLAMHMLRTNPTIQINNISVFEMPTNSMNFLHSFDIQNVIKNIVEISKIDDITDIISNTSLKEIMSDESLLERDYGTSFIEQLLQYVPDDNKLNSNLRRLIISANEKLRSGRFHEVDRSSLIKAIKKRMAVLKVQGSDTSKEYELLSGALLEYEARLNPNKFMVYVQDMNKLSEFIKTSWNMAEPVAQGVVDTYLKAKFALMQNVKNGFDSMKSAKEEFYAKHKHDNNSEYLKAKVFNASSNIFNPIYQKREVWRTVNGQRVKDYVTVPFLIHHDVNDAVTKEALRKGEIDMSIVNYGKAVKQAIEDEMIKSIQFSKSASSNREYTVEEARKILDSDLEGYMFSDIGGFFVPVIQKTQAELLFKGMKDKDGSLIKDWRKRYWGEIANDKSLFSEISGETEANKVTNMFKRQMASMNNVMSESGMKMNKDGSLEIVDENRFGKISTNVEMMSSSFLLANARERIYEDMFIPVYNAGQALLRAKGVKYKGDDQHMKNTMNWLKEYFEVLVKRESPDSKLESKALRNTASTVKFMLRSFSNSTLGFSIKVGIKSLAQMEIMGLTTSLSNKIAQLGVPENLRTMEDELLSNKNWGAAHKFVGTNWDFAWTLARKFQVIDGQEYDLLMNPVYQKSNRYALQSNMMHVFNWGGDNMVRVIGTIAWLRQQGALDAYSYNKLTGEITYNEKNDRRYYNEDGTPVESGMAQRQIVLEENIKGGFQNPEVKELQWGDNYRTMSQVKRTLDRWITGSMTEDTRWQLSNHFLGKMVSQFRVFSDERLFRAGLFASTRETTLGTGYETVTDKYGNEVTYAAAQQIEGFWQSGAAALKEIYNLKNVNVKEWEKTMGDFWKESSHERRTNLARAGVQLGMFLLFYTLVNINIPDEEEESDFFKALSNYQRHYKFLYQDMFDLITMTEFLKSPIPMYQALSDISDVILGNKELSIMRRYVPGLYSAEYMYETMEVLTQDEEYFQEKENQRREEMRMKRLEKRMLEE